MEIPTKSSIFLQGVFLSQVRTPDDYIIDDSIIQDDPILYDPSPRQLGDIRATRFRNKKQWAEAYKDSTLKCWYCGLSFKGAPCFIPRQIRNTTHGKEYDAHGLFCGFACAFSFLKTQSEFVRSKTYFDKLEMLKLLFIQFHNKKVVEFKKAPYIYDMTLYGGHVDIVEYRNNLKAINTAIINEAKHIQVKKRYTASI